MSEPEYEYGVLMKADGVWSLIGRPHFSVEQAEWFVQQHQEHNKVSEFKIVRRAVGGWENPPWDLDQSSETP